MPTLFIDPGALRTEFSLEAPADTPDGAGGLVAGWVEVATVFALVEPASPEHRFGVAGVAALRTHRITLRHRSDVHVGCRLRRGERVFELLAVSDPDESQRYLMCLARETRS